MKLSIVIPAYNESEGIAHTASKMRPVVKQLQETYEVELIIVDDGSSDNTGELLRAEFAEDEYVRVISYEVNQGLGGAMRTGFQHVQGDIIVTTDFDGTYDFATITEMLTYLDDPNVDMVSASPYHPQGSVEGVPQYRLVFSFGASLLYRLLVSWHIHTWTSLFRAYRRPVIDSITFENNGFLSLTEFLVNTIKQGYKVTEYPTVLHTRQFGQSSIRIAQVTMEHLKYQSRLLTTASPLRLVGLLVSVIGVLFIISKLLGGVFNHNQKE